MCVLKAKHRAGAVVEARDDVEAARLVSRRRRPRSRARAGARRRKRGALGFAPGRILRVDGDEPLKDLRRRACPVSDAGGSGRGSAGPASVDGAAEEVRRLAASRRSRRSSMKTIRSAARRAKPISWVTTTLVMPSAVSSCHDVEHLADHLGIERGGRLVVEHQRGLHGERAGDGDALLLPAGQFVGIGSRPSPGCGPCAAARRRCRERRPGACRAPSSGRQHDVLDGGEVLRTVRSSGTPCRSRGAAGASFCARA